MKIKITIYALILLVFTLKTTAQDIHYTNFLSAPQILNPAQAGNDPGRYRIQNNYRKQGNQIANPYITNIISFDMPVYYYSEKGAVGLIYINDKSADKTLISNQIYLNSGYFRKISKSSYLHFGFQAGYVIKKYSLSNLTFPDQFDMSSGYFNTAMPTGENLDNQQSSYFDLNWGMMWSVKKEKYNGEIGFAMFHYNRPEQSFFANNEKLPPRYAVHADYTRFFSQNQYVKPKFLLTKQNSAHEVLFGFDAGKKLKSDNLKDVRFGIGYRGGLQRVSDAVEFNIGAFYKNFQIAAAFDFDLSNQKAKLMARNAFEISVVYKCPASVVRFRTTACDIY
jgi:type IX secretion system PorP/SprF family membrane protein